MVTESVRIVLRQRKYLGWRLMHEEQRLERRGDAIDLAADISVNYKNEERDIRYPGQLRPLRTYISANVVFPTIIALIFCRLH